MKVMGENIEDNGIDIKTKRTMKIIIIIIVMLLAVSIVLFITIYNLKEQLFKFMLDGVETDMPTSDLFVYEEENVYVSIYDIARLVGYKYYRGGYKEYTEDTNKCYLENKNEISIFEDGEELIYKTPTDRVDYEFFQLDKPIKTINNKLYITSKGLETACNLKFNYNREKNIITINTLDSLVKYYNKNYPYSAVRNNFNNQKALLYGLLVTQSVKNSDSSQSGGIDYGISNLNNQEIVGKKYKDINFIESTQEFTVKTAEGKVGIISLDGKTKLSPQYDRIKKIDKNLNLYLVENNGKQGVIEQNAKTLIYPEYDQIGIDSTKFLENNVKNPYVLFNNAIPVRKNNKWGMYDVKGNLILDLEYDGFGCIANNNSSSNVLIVPDIKTIVVAKNYGESYNGKTTYYGFVNYLGRQIVPAGLQRVYKTVSDGRTEYFMEYNGTIYDVITKLKEIVPKLEE